MVAVSRYAVCSFLALNVVGGCDRNQPFGPENPSFAVTSSKLGAPSGTDAIPVLSDRVDVSWTDNSTSEGAFRVERSSNGGASWVGAAVVSANSVRFADTGRASEQRVCYRVFATAGQSGNGAASPASPIDCTTPPAAPTALTATAVNSHTVDLTWKDNSAVEDGYYLTRDGSLVTKLPANATSYRDTALTSGTTHTYRVQPTKDGGFGSQSNAATVTTPVGPPPPPSGTNAVALSGGSARVTWIDNSLDEDGFQVDSAPTNAGPWGSFLTTSRNATTMFDNIRVPEQQRCYRVAALNAHGASEPSKVDCATAPAAPSNLQATASGETAIDLTWTDNSGLEDGYEVERSSLVVAVLGPNATSYHDAGLPPDATYGYRVRAKKDDGSSDYSDVAIGVAASTPPAAPLGTFPVPDSGSVIVVYWTDNSLNEEGFRIERSTDGGANWVPAGALQASTIGFADRGRTSEQRVCYHVLAFNRAGASGPSETACTTLPAGPTGLVATTIDYQTIDLAWTDNSGVEDGYGVFRRDVASWGYEFVAELPANATSFRDTGLWSGTWYIYYVVAMKDLGNSDYSNDASAVTDAAPAGTASAPRSATPTTHSHMWVPAQPRRTPTTRPHKP